MYFKIFKPIPNSYAVVSLQFIHDALCRMGATGTDICHAFLKLCIPLLLRQRPESYRFALRQFHLERNAALQNDLPQEHTDRIGHGDPKLIQYLFCLLFDFRLYTSEYITLCITTRTFLP